MTRKKMPLFEKTKKYGEKIENSKSLLKGSFGSSLLLLKLKTEKTVAK